MKREVLPNDGRPNYCLHQHHLDPAVEAKAREIYMTRNGSHGGWWELNETPEPWWDMATDALRVVCRGESREVAPDDGCCHKTRLRDAPCPLGLVCPHINKEER